MNIDFKNIENLIIDKNIWKLLPELTQLFNQWKLAKQLGLRTLERKSAMDILNSLEKEQISKLENYFQDSIIVDKINYNLVKNYEFKLDNLNVDLSEFQEFALYRNANNLYLTGWK